MTLQPVARQFLRRVIPPDIPLKEYWSAGLHIYGPKPFVPSEALAYIYPEDAAQAQGERNYRSLDDAQAQANSPGRVCH